ncbi:MAG TPA: hypothetical protein VK154_16725 [Chitinophagales bacterium]|nr:hypothetical protein [Chitinophagales bacterium]
MQELIDGLAENLKDGKETETNKEIERLAPLLSLKQMHNALEYFYSIWVKLLKKETDYNKMQVVQNLCIARGEDICPYLDKTAFGDDSCIQGYAIDILCKMAATKGTRKQKTLELINENLDDFYYETLMPTMYSLGYFENEPLVEEMFKRQLEQIKGSYIDFITMLKPCVWNYKKIVKGYMPLLKTIILESDEKDYSLFEMAYIMKSKNGEEMKAYDEKGNEFTAEEGIEANKLSAAAIFFEVEKYDPQVNAFIAEVAQNSKFESHKKCAESLLAKN